MPDQQRELDLVLLGATGFVGRLTAAYLARTAPEDARIGLAGRSTAKLERVRAELGARAADWPLITADSGDRASLDALAARTVAVASSVGPYRQHGMPLVEACAAAGTHYADLTGEALFVRESIDRAHDVARGTGARIVHACGFDAIPSDLGVLLAFEAARADGAGPLEDTTLVVTGVRGGLSGGTIASMKGMVDEAKRDPDARRTMLDPHCLSPDRASEPDVGKLSDAQGPSRDAELGMWIGPFVMAPFNTRIVRRSNALMDHAYGRGFRYREVMGFTAPVIAPLLAVGTAAGTAVLTAALVLPPTRMVLDRLLPKPGEGPSEKTREKGFFRIDVHARTTSGARYVTKIAASGDPGYAATAVLFGEAGLALALDGERLPARAGVLTPATAIGDVLAERLRAAGHTYEASRR